MVARRAVIAAIVAGLLGLMGDGVHASDDPNRSHKLTFSGPVRLPGVVLPAGRYTFELANGWNLPDVVRVMSDDRRTSYFMGFTRLVERPERLADNAFVTFGESRPGTPPPIVSWYPEDSK